MHTASAQDGESRQGDPRPSPAGKTAAGNPLVSVVVPVYNAEGYLAVCLDSLLAQTLSDIEVVAIDDGSTDASGAILANYARRDARIRFVSRENKGYGATVNEGIERARGTFVGIVEPDDYVEPSMYEKLSHAARRFDADMVKCDFYDTYATHETPRYNLSELPHGVVFDPADEPQAFLVMPSIWAALYRKDWILECGIACRPTPGASFQDTSFFLECMGSARRCVAVGLPLVHYRRDNPASSVVSTDKVFDVADEFSCARSFLARDEERYRRIAGHLWLDAWRTHRWDATRLPKEVRGAYFTRVAEEFARADAAGEINRELFAPAELERLESLLAADASALECFDAANEASPLTQRPVRTRSRSVKVSVVVAAHNAATLLPRALNSCLAQTHRNIEVVCVDDGSTDTTAQVARAYERKDDRVQAVVLEHNMRTHNARLAGVERASGELVMFLDADDELHRSACARAAAEFVSQPYDILQMAPRVVREGTVGRAEARDMEAWCAPPEGEVFGRDILISTFVDFAHSAQMWGKAFRAPLARAALQSIGSIEADYGEDQMEYFAVACRSYTLRGLPKALYRYHLGDGASAPGTMDAENFARVVRGADSLRGIRCFLDRSEMLPECAPILEVHRLGQEGALIRTLLADVADADRPACWRAYLKEWEDGSF